MLLPREIHRIVLLMMEYQKMNNVKGLCIDNATYLRDSMQGSGFAAKMKAVMAVTNRDGGVEICAHQVVEWRGMILDPSYEVAHRSPRYADTIDSLNDLDKMTAEVKRAALEGFLNMVRSAEKCNGKDLYIVNRHHYDAQADYVAERSGGTSFNGDVPTREEDRW